MKLRIFWSVFFSLLVFLFLSFRLSGTVSFGGDFARDMYDLLTIAQGKFMLIGPKLSFGGIYTGPYYYYLLLPAYILSGLSINAVVFWNAALFGIGAGVLFLVLSSKFSILKSLLFESYMFTLPMILVGARNPSNAYTYTPLFVILISYIFFHKIDSILKLTLVGFAMGVMMNFHLATVVVFTPLIAYLFFQLKNKKLIFFLFLGIGIAYLPLLLFEVKHNFIMFKNTFINKSYLAFTNNENLPGNVAPKKDLIANMLFLAPYIQEWTVLNPLLILAIIVMPNLFRHLIYFVIPAQAGHGPLGGIQFQKMDPRVPLREASKHEDDRAERIAPFRVQPSMLLPLASFILLALTLRFQFASHYLYPFSLLLTITLATLLIKSKWWPILIVLIVFNLYKAPNYFYGKTDRTPEKIQLQVDYLQLKRLINKNDMFNVLLLRKDTGLTPVGHEYRYFLRKTGYVPQSEFAYKESRKLIIVSEFKDLDLKSLQSWEAKEFGLEYIQRSKKYVLLDVTFYVAKK